MSDLVPRHLSTPLIALLAALLALAALAGTADARERGDKEKETDRGARKCDALTENVIDAKQERAATQRRRAKAQRKLRAARRAARKARSKGAKRAANRRKGVAAKQVRNANRSIKSYGDKINRSKEKAGALGC